MYNWIPKDINPSINVNIKINLFFLLSSSIKSIFKSKCLINKHIIVIKIYITKAKLNLYIGIDVAFWVEILNIKVNGFNNSDSIRIYKIAGITMANIDFNTSILKIKCISKNWKI